MTMEDANVPPVATAESPPTTIWAILSMLAHVGVVILSWAEVEQFQLMYPLTPIHNIVNLHDAMTYAQFPVQHMGPSLVGFNNQHQLVPPTSSTFHGAPPHMASPTDTPPWLPFPSITLHAPPPGPPCQPGSTIPLSTACHSATPAAVSNGHVATGSLLSRTVYTNATTAGFVPLQG